RNAWRAAAAHGNFVATVVIDRGTQDLCGTPNDEFKFFSRVEIEPVNDAETRPQRSGDQSGASRGANQRETAKVQSMCPGAGSLTDDDVEFEVLHCGIENL